MDKSFWKGKKVFITGHTGFKGGWLSIWLAESGAEVTGYSLKPETNPSLFNSCLIEKKINSVIGDVRDEQKLKKIIREAQPDIVFHLASQALVLKSYENPLEKMETNLQTSNRCYLLKKNLYIFFLWILLNVLSQSLSGLGSFGLRLLDLDLALNHIVEIFDVEVLIFIWSGMHLDSHVHGVHLLHEELG